MGRLWSTDDVMTSHVIMRVLVRPMTGRRPNPRCTGYVVLATSFSSSSKALAVPGDRVEEEREWETWTDSELLLFSKASQNSFVPRKSMVTL